MGLAFVADTLSILMSLHEPDIDIQGEATEEKTQEKPDSEESELPAIETVPLDENVNDAPGPRPRMLLPVPDTVSANPVPVKVELTNAKDAYSPT
jgi:hypothetical protein